MSDKNPKPPDSPESDFTKQWPSELSEYLNLDDDEWPYDDLDSFVSEHVLSHNTQVGELGGSSSSNQNEEFSSSKNKVPEMKFILLSS